jgi:hypothetical protein
MTQQTIAIPSPENNYHSDRVMLILDNLKRWTNYDLIQDYGFSLANLGAEVFNADFYLLSHNGAIDPILNYGNQQVLDLWEVSWDELMRMYSKDTAKPDDRSARSQIMNQVKTQNYITGYNGVRVSKTGKEFQILDVTIWNLFTDNGNPYGQAAWFKNISIDSFKTSI